MSGVQHRANGLHLFCRLRDCGVPAGLARRIAGAWEALAHAVIYRRRTA
ncbi:MAG: hypothetical protein KKB70_01830 [Proteobacteria bacterium]|nr:hypothetical protein [Pseudomonadota bacterium]MBU1611396.1 hypothetical protein [Pseudomonadota bacterium]